MAKPVEPLKVKLFIGLLYQDEAICSRAINILSKKYGIIDHKSEPIPFTHTSYYNEIGKNLYKVFISFEKLIKREKISKIKLYTNKIEDKFSIKNKRQINIDPGYLTLSNVFLASCKDYFHRVYIGNGIYIENEYKFVAKHFEPWEWTYPDYKKPEYIKFFEDIRNIYYKQIKKFL